MSGPVAAADVAPDAPAAAASSASATEAGAPPNGPPTAAASTPAAPERSLLLPAFEIIGFDFLLNRIDRSVGTGRDDYRVTVATIRRNLKSDWGTDHDPFKINQLGHPYQGSMYHGFARSAGFNYWESAGYTFAGSALWEIAGESTLPSRNDQVASGIGGTFLGEALFRMSNLVLEKGGGMSPFWRELTAAAISPSSGFNRLVFDDRFGGIYSSHGAEYFSRMQLGLATSVKNEVGPSGAGLKRDEAQANFAIDYGLPGKPDYDYRRPFDYFAFQATASSANIFESVFTRGLLVGAPYEAGDNYRGVWGLYGSYDYVSPQTFRVSSTSLALGSTAQWWLSPTLSLQGTALAGVGYAAVGTTRGPVGERSYNYGVAPQALLALRLTHGDTASLDLTARDFFVSRVASGTNAGHDNIVRIDAALTLRIYKQHAVTFKVVANRRDATFANPGTQTQTRATIGIYYTLLGQERFGAVDWRKPAEPKRDAGIAQ
ncbi:MAG TPA: DUF3943 domain-containing protein [Caldimonas sp.]|nr:DUF3943 domain-containing protein [Caldimonas sp.]